MEFIVETARENLRATREEYRRTVGGLSPEAINWRPGPDTNSAAVLVTHIAGSEGELLRVIRGLPAPRDREAEFHVTADSAAELLAKLDAMEALFDELAPAITADDLRAERTRYSGRTNTGLFWLLHNITHLREHLGHVQLTAQLFEQQRGGQPAPGEAS